MKLSKQLFFSVFLVLTLALTCYSSAQETAVAEAPEIQAIIDEGRNSSQVQDHLDYLTNRIGPRLTGSEGLQAGCEWARDRFKEMGLSNSRLEQWGEVAVGFERGPASGRMIEPKSLNLNFGTNSWTAGTKGRVVGNALMAPKSMEELESMRAELKGAYVFTPRSVRGMRGGGRRGGGARGQNPGGGAGGAAQAETKEAETKTDEEKAAEAAKAEEARLEAEKAAAEQAVQSTIREELLKIGVAGLIQPTADDLIVTGGSFRIEWDNLPTTPIISLQKVQYDEIQELITSGEKVSLGFDIRNHFRKGPISLNNVIADIPGTEFPDEYVIVGGHIDSWDGASGATDNGAGCATTMEAARILMAAGVKPRRTIRFMLWSGEEQGLLGSMAYVAKHPEEMARISTVLVHDGGTNYVAGIRGTKLMTEDFERIFAPATRLDERAPFVVGTTDAIVPRGGSDHVSFIQAGVPGFFWEQQGRAVYRNTHHTQYDTYDSVVPEYQMHSSIVIAIGAYGIANLDYLLPREGVQTGR